MSEARKQVHQCPFCEIEASRIVEQSDLSLVIRDAFPVTPLHTLIIPKRHVGDYFDLTGSERSDIDRLLLCERERLAARDQNIAGFNFGINCGVAAGQTVMHAHVHLIPRRVGDVSEPRGGVRGVIPGKQKYDGPA